MKGLINEARAAYHRALVSERVLTISKSGIASNADKSNKPSCAIAALIARKLNAYVDDKSQGQTAGTAFEYWTMRFFGRHFSQTTTYSAWSMDGEKTG